MRTAHNGLLRLLTRAYVGCQLAELVDMGWYLYLDGSTTFVLKGSGVCATWGPLV